MELELIPTETLRSAKPPEEEFAALEADASLTLASAEKIIVTDVSQVDAMKQAREVRLDLRKLRVAVERRHKELKAFYLEGGRRIDRIKNALVPHLEREEARLLACEQFREREAERIRQELTDRRRQALEPFGFPGVDSMNLAAMTGEEFGILLDQAAQLQEARKAAAEKAAAEKAAAEQAAAEEAARVRAENERLRVEAAKAREAEREAKLLLQAAAAAERAREAAAKQEAEARVKAEREAAEAAAAERAREAAAKQEAEARVKAEREAAEAAAAAPDAEKMAAVAGELRALLDRLQQVTMQGRAGMDILATVRARVFDAVSIAAAGAKKLLPY
jgi:colicin import membrane protein